MSLYDELGIPEDATDEEIKAAHRREIKKAHPDVGGDAETFQRKQHAYLVLADPEARARYDRTGDDGKTSASLDASEVLQRVFATIDTVIRSEQDLDHNDVAAVMRAHLAKIRGSIEAQLAVPTNLQARARKALKRLRRKAKAPETASILTQALETIVRDRQKEIEAAQRNLDIHLQVEAIFMAFDYDFEAQPPLYAAQRSAFSEWGFIDRPADPSIPRRP